jgi:hypothetical protein
MKFSSRMAFVCVATVGVLLVALPVATVAAEASPATTVLAGKTIKLVGSGFRYKGPFKVNFVEIFAADRFASLDELARQDGPKRVSMTIQQDVSSNFMGKSLTRGIEDNVSKSEFSPLIPSLIRLGDMFNEHKSLAAGSKVLIDWVPGVGTVITINGVQQGDAFKDPGLFKAILAIWLGPVPVDFKLKDALLGIKS